MVYPPVLSRQIVDALSKEGPNRQYIGGFASFPEKYVPACRKVVVVAVKTDQFLAPFGNKKRPFRPLHATLFNASYRNGTDWNA